MLRVDLKTLLGLILLKEYCHVVVRKNRGRFLGDILLQAMPTSSLPLLYSTIVLYDTFMIEIIPLYKIHVIMVCANYAFYN